MIKSSSSAETSARGRRLLLAALTAMSLAGGLAATPALADHHGYGRHERWEHHGRWDRHYHPGWVRYYDGPYIYWAPPPPRVFYAPPPPPPVYYAPPPVYYGGPSLNVVIPIR